MSVLCRRALQAPWLPRAVIGILMLVVVYLLLTNPSQNAAVKPTSSTKGKGGVNRAQVMPGSSHLLWCLHAVPSTIYATSMYA